jgi:hypothetical protein
MKQAQSSKTAQTTQKGNVRVENKDNIDSRHNEEEMVKKNHLTNNEKENHSLGKKQSQHQK